MVVQHKELFEKISDYLPERDVANIKEAFNFSEKCHFGQKRRSGEPFIEHPYQTALYLADLKLDKSTLSAALLHDVIEDCDVSYADIQDKFGKEVANLVDSVTKLNKVEVNKLKQAGGYSGEGSIAFSKAATVQKMLVAMADDIRVVLIKLADRLHNMKTLKALSRQKQLAISQETLDIYAPLAHRLGIWEMKWLLEDLAFQFINPDEYKNIASLLNSKRIEREQYIDNVVEEVNSKFTQEGVVATVTGRAKHIYSIYKKIQLYSKMNKNVGQIYDLFALRILVNDRNDCYRALGVVHSMWRPLPGEFDDYIASPKDNMYQSIHTTVLCEAGSPVEIQIRTEEMHRLAEYGVAAHWLYKEGSVEDVNFEEKMNWIRQMLEWQRNEGPADQFVESFKTDIFKDQVYVYTPLGELKELPSNSTVLDFAYRIHTDIGHRCIGAKVNNKLVELKYNLVNGDTVEILTDETITGPNVNWLDLDLGYVSTSSAREKIKQWFNRQNRQENLRYGKDIFYKQLQRLGTGLQDQQIAELVGFSTVDEFMVSLGNGDLTIQDVVKALATNEISLSSNNKVMKLLPEKVSLPNVEIVGAGDLLTRMGKCCRPIHGDEIVGYMTRNRGVTIHRYGCSNPEREDVEKLIDVSWGKSQVYYPVRIKIEAWDRVGLLRDITSLVSGEKVNIASCISEEVEDLSIISLTVYINGIDQLSRLCSKLESIGGVISVKRISASVSNK
ncbi:MAG: bifunctional (p)ppGpp synthetase/guanosine-3',5'-bis(diphosphate) 3'-pyrophosphohydrolase [SAR202 cluster bacterium]|nr:bifunctional (p)ppGpp synthetase/guanosine-3',5'-bis(diphosphate) 3'-pyrophosphohydrolase [SAR202 cluster bacterium]